MNDDKMTTIIAADYMYLVFLGDDNTIQKLLNKLNNPMTKNSDDVPKKNTNNSMNRQKNKTKNNKNILN